MPTTMSSSSSVKPTERWPRPPTVGVGTFEVAENGWPANPRANTGSAARARCTFTPRRQVLGRANIWGSVVLTPTNRLASSILKKNSLRKSDYCAFQTDAAWDAGSERLWGCIAATKIYASQLLNLQPRGKETQKAERLQVPPVCDRKMGDTQPAPKGHGILDF